MIPNGADPGAAAPRKPSLVVPVVTLLVLAVLVWGYAQPYFALAHLREVAKSGDREALAQCVDFPALRQNLKTSIGSMMVKRAAGDPQGDPLAVLGAVVARVVVDPLVDNIVTPDGIGMLADGQRLFSGEPPTVPADAQRETGVRVRQGYARLDEFHATVTIDAGRTPISTFVFHRRGLRWVLTDIRVVAFS